MMRKRDQSKINLKNLSFSDLTIYCEKNGLRRYCGKQVFSWIYGKRVEEFGLMTDLPVKTREFLEEKFCFFDFISLKKEVSADGTEKYLFGLSDGSAIETVIIPEGARITLCVSTQIGCKFRCGFCVSGRDRFKRNLEVSEIVDQFLKGRDAVYPRKITNVVLMGAGEPLDNFDNVVKSLGILREPLGINLGKRRICVSTAGIPAKIKLLAESVEDVRLSLSLHAANQKKREAVMPVAGKYPLSEVMEAVRFYSARQPFPVTFEYVLLGGFNCSAGDAIDLSRLIRGINCKINIIPYNVSRFFPWKEPSPEEIESFTSVLRDKRVFFTLRRARGRDINAACGQLKTWFSRKGFKNEIKKQTGPE